jgi:hypothetical protein
VVEGARLESVYTVIPYRGFEPSAAQQRETTPERSDGGPEGVRAAGPNHPDRG